MHASEPINDSSAISTTPASLAYCNTNTIRQQMSVSPTSSTIHRRSTSYEETAIQQSGIEKVGTTQESSKGIFKKHK